jgi:hypothetical protein
MQPKHPRFTSQVVDMSATQRASLPPWSPHGRALPEDADAGAIHWDRPKALRGASHRTPPTAMIRQSGRPAAWAASLSAAAAQPYR